MTAENLGQMLASRAESKTLMRSSSRTMIRAVDNNPLKFAGSPAEALGIMFGPRTRNYLDARTTIERSISSRSGALVSAPPWWRRLTTPSA